MRYEAIICFEVHVELATATKLFCGCPTHMAVRPNTHICPVCTGQPGTLPVLNRKAVALAVKAGLALGCEIRPVARFARKNYFYPDLPKNYQISQFEAPFCEKGALEIAGEDNKPYAVGIRRVHLEEDAGKLVHPTGSLGDAPYSLVDYNRAGVPLLEIVGDHERNPIRSIPEARDYLERLRQILRYTGISTCVLEQGQFRCDVNVSLRPQGSRAFLPRTEIKNMSSFKAVMEALDHEIRRQGALLDEGRTPAQETRLFDEATRRTCPMRGKEEAADYRYFPEPDLLEVRVDPPWVEALASDLPELPETTRRRLARAHGLTEEEARLLTREKETADFFDACVRTCGDPKRVCNWILRDLFALLKASHTPLSGCRVSPEGLGRLLRRLAEEGLPDQVGKGVLREMFASGEAPEPILQRVFRGSTPQASLKEDVDAVIRAFPESAASVAGGKREALNHLMGQVLKRRAGQADPRAVRALLEERLMG